MTIGSASVEDTLGESARALKGFEEASWRMREVSRSVLFIVEVEIGIDLSRGK